MRKEWGLLLMSFVHIHCVNITIDQRVANYKETFTQTINSTYQFILFFPDIETANPFRVKAWSTDALAEQPVLIVVQQERQVTSWQVPLLVDSSKGHSIVTFLNTSKTMCHDQMDSIVNSDFSIGDQKVSQSFILALATSSKNSVSINIALEEEEHFYVTLDETYTLSISPSEPRYVFYNFDENASDTVIIEVDSDDDTCLTVSIQDSRCPVLDMNKDIKYEGYYQTVNLKGAITIRRNQYRNGFFVVFVAKPDNYDCSQENSYIPRQLRTVHILTLNVSSTITFKIRNSISMSDYIIASLGTLIVCSIVGVVLTITALVLNRFGTISKNKYEDILITDYYEALSDDQIHKLLKSEKLTVSYFARHPKRIKQRSYNYLSHTLSIALFYSIPVVQLVVTYQRIVNQTGNEDMCYYNFLCAHPALGFSDFNHIYSNIGYVIFGIIFIFVVIDRHTIIKIRKEKGIPVHYGLFHAMGVALIIEGLLSACYHICPSQSNYQFDTSFMYVMAVLCMIKLYQNRHPDVNATAYSTFAVLGGTIFLVPTYRNMQTEWGLLLIIFVLVHCTNNIKIEQRMVSYNETFRENINSTCQLVLVYPNISTVNPFRVKAWSTNANIENPVLVVVQQKKQVTSWQVPLLVETRNRKILMFSNTSKTMCHDKMDLIVMHKLSDIVNISPDLPVNNNRLLYQSFILAIASASTTNVNINIQLEEEDGFYLQLNKTYTMSISPSEPRYYFYKFGRDASDTVVIEIESKNKICLIVSVQDSRCPVFDTNKDIKYEGHYQTINLRGAMTVKRSDFGGVFFIVFVAKPDNYDCSQESSYIPRLAKKVPISPLKSTSTVTFKIRNGINQQDYLQASLGTLAAMLILGGILTGLAMIFNRFGTVSKIKCNDDKVMDIYEHLSKDEIKELLHLGKLTVSHFSRYPKTSKQRSYDYLSHTMSTAIFYSIPVVQLVITYQRMVDQTGNEDMCYFNFFCAHPALGFSDFNHIFSNIGYVIFGIIFIFAVSDRQHLIKPRKDKGIPVHYGIYHAMGVALIIEGLLSASYHICPSQSNYQFDTSFMYIMAVLCMIKLYQNRHPDINANAYSTFTVLGATIFVAMIGILDGSLAIWIIFILAYIILCAVLSFKIYFVNYVLYGVKQLKENYENHGFRNDMLVPIRKARFTLLCITNVANFAMILVGFCLYTDKETDFGTFLLGLLMGNTVIYGGFYVCMKLVNKERICFEAVFYLICSIISWAGASAFFLDSATHWTVTPAESRHLNQNCIMLNFFDKHDVWHLLSAPALYFSFMFLMCLDDDIIDTNQKEITVF